MSFSVNKYFIRFQDKLYIAKYHYPEHQIKDVNGLKEYYNASISLRKDGRIFFCDEVEDVEEITEGLLEENISVE
jgi:hypothetical protein